MPPQTMPPTKETWDPEGLWAAYAPDAQGWDLRRVVHLHRRAGFGATWAELQRDLKGGPAPSIDRLLGAKARAEGVPETFEHTAERLASAGAPHRYRKSPAENADDLRPDDPSRLRGWWIYRMYCSPDSLGERLTLMWHNHFATSDLKVRDLSAMRRQNETFRRLARAPFGELLRAMACDPALLVWLDAPLNRKGHPNENLARELMELFTLGIGHYTEIDVKEAARALTGWVEDEGDVHEDPELHDAGEKIVLGRKGRWKSEDLVRILLDHPATSRRLAWRLCDLFMGEGAANAAALDALAAGLRAHDLDVGWAVGTVLRSRLFFGEKNRGNRVLGPVEYAVGVARALERFDSPPRSLLLGEWVARMGMELFYPPNVGGWSGGRAWLTTQRIVARANYAVALVQGKLTERPNPLDAASLAERHGHGRDMGSVLTFCATLLTGAPADAAWVKRLVESLRSQPGREPASVAGAVALLIASPEVQLC
jgi:uncharacterized protein (DUF1800 family)